MKRKSGARVSVSGKLKVRMKPKKEKVVPVKEMSTVDGQWRCTKIENVNGVDYAYFVCVDE